MEAALGELAAERPLACRVRGASMRPLLEDGERVELSRPRFYWPGDVVALVSPGGHRLVHRLLGFYWWGRWLAVTQGDAAPAPDSPVPVSSLLGRVHAAEGQARGLAPKDGARGLAPKGGARGLAPKGGARGLAPKGGARGLAHIPGRMRLRACRLYWRFLAARLGARLSP